MYWARELQWRVTLGLCVGRRTCSGGGGWEGTELRWERPWLHQGDFGWESLGSALDLRSSLGFAAWDARGSCLALLCSAPDMFWKNPQFLLSVWRPQKCRRLHMPCSVLVSLLQKPRHRHRNRKPYLAIGFYLVRVGGLLMSSDPFLLVPVLFTLCARLLTSFSVCHVCRSWLCPLGTCVLAQATSLHLYISFSICTMGTMIFMQKWSRMPPIVPGAQLVGSILLSSTPPKNPGLPSLTLFQNF